MKYFVVRSGRIILAFTLAPGHAMPDPGEYLEPGDVIYRDCRTPADAYNVVHYRQGGCEVELFRAPSDGPEDPPRWAEVVVYDQDETGAYIRQRRPAEPMAGRAVAEYHCRADGIYRRRGKTWQKWQQSS